MNEPQAKQVPERRVVTAEQLSEGYFERIGAFIYHRRYVVIKKGIDYNGVPDGTYVVEEPKVKHPGFPTERNEA